MYKSFAGLLVSAPSKVAVVIGLAKADRGKPLSLRPLSVSVRASMVESCTDSVVAGKASFFFAVAIGFASGVELVPMATTPLVLDCEKGWLNDGRTTGD